MAQLARKHGALDVRVAQTAEESLRLATARRSAFSALARVAPTTILEDVTVPRSELAGMVAFIQELAKRHNLRIGVFGHMGDGNLHPTFLTNEKNAEEMHRVELAFQEIVTETVRRGGTDHRRARRRPREEEIPARIGRRPECRDHAQAQAALRSEPDSQSGEDV